MRFQRVSNSMVRANLNVMGRPARKILSDYAKRNNLTLEEATRKTLGFVREFERRSSMEIDNEAAGFTPFVTFLGMKQPTEPIFVRAVSKAERGRIPTLPKIPRFKIKDAGKEYAKEYQKYVIRTHKKYKTLNELADYELRQQKIFYKKPITKLEILRNNLGRMDGGTYKYCTTYSTKCLKEVVKFLEKKPASTNALSMITHEMREILDPHINAETSLHIGTDQKDKRIAQTVYRKLQKELR